MIPSASIPAVRQNRSKLTETASQALSTAPIPVGGKAVNGVIAFFMALLSFRGISTPSLPAQGEQRRSSYFNIPRGNSERRHRRPQGRPSDEVTGRLRQAGRALRCPRRVLCLGDAAVQHHDLDGPADTECAPVLCPVFSCKQSLAHR